MEGGGREVCLELVSNMFVVVMECTNYYGRSVSCQLIQDFQHTLHDHKQVCDLTTPRPSWSQSNAMTCCVMNLLLHTPAFSECTKCMISGTEWHLPTALNFVVS